MATMPEPFVAGAVAAVLAGGSFVALVPALLTDNDAAVLIALIGAVSSILAAQQARKGVKEGRSRRVVITHQEGGTNVSNEDLDELEDDGGE